LRALFRGANVDVPNHRKETVMKLTRTNTTLARQAGTLAVSLALGTLFIAGSMNATAAEGQTSVTLAAQQSTNGAAGQMPAYYDGALFTVNMKELSQTASNSIITKDPSVNEIYASNDLDEEQDFIPVISAIQGEGFNPLWRHILLVFNDGFTPHQFVSEEEIEAAAAGTNPEITLVETDEVYRCSVVGGIRLR
jgi:hypothetical protein